MGKGGLILEGTHTNKKKGARFFHLWGVPHSRQSRTPETGFAFDTAMNNHLIDKPRQLTGIGTAGLATNEANERDSERTNWRGRRPAPRRPLHRHRGS